MIRGTRMNQRTIHLASTAFALVLLLAHGLFFDFVIDDAYISLRYAQNLVDGHGLVFNPGEAVEGYSNLLWVLLAAVGLKLGVPALLWLRILGTAAAAGLLAVAPGLVKRLAPEAEAPLAGPSVQLLLALTGAVACWTLAGLETVLFALLIALAWRAALDRDELAAGIFSFLLVLTRPEGVALGLIFMAWTSLPREGETWGDRARRWSPGRAIFLVGTAAFFLWRHETYGQLLPNTYFAKTGDPRGQFDTGLPYTLGFLLRYGLPLVAAMVAAGFQGGRRILAGRPFRLTVALIVFWLAYVTMIGGDMLGMFRFWVPILPMLVVTAVAVMAAAGWLARPQGAVPVVLVLGAVLLVSSFQGRERRLVDIHMSEANLGGWMLAGDAMAAQLPSDATVALGPAGYIAWKTGMRTIDFYGIVTPHIAHLEVDFEHGYAGHEKTDGPWVVSRRPDTGRWTSCWIHGSSGSTN